MQGPTSRTVAFLFGAGASARHGYPTVNKFFSHFKGGEGSLDACETLHRWIKVLERPDSRERFPDVDAEEVFGLAELLLQVEKALQVDSTIPLKIGNKGISASELYSRLIGAIIEIYGKPLGGPSADSDPLFTALKVADTATPPDEPLWLFTTNYDTVIEDSLSRCEELQKIFSLEVGFDLRSPRRFNHGRFGAPIESGARPVNVVKLHGSINWKHETTDPNSPVVLSDARVPTKHDCLLYFGYKKFPEQEPFAELHRLFKRVLLSPATLVTLGFRFADPYLRELVDLALDANRDLRVICCLNAEPEKCSPVADLVRRHATRFEMLRDPAGNIVEFGADGFRGALEAQFQLPAGAAS